MGKSTNLAWYQNQTYNTCMYVNLKKKYIYTGVTFVYIYRKKGNIFLEELEMGGKCMMIQGLFPKKRCVKGMIMSNIVILYFKIDGIPQRRMLNMSVECDVSVGHCQRWVDRGEPYHSYITKYSIQLSSNCSECVSVKVLGSLVELLECL